MSLFLLFLGYVLFSRSSFIMRTSELREGDAQMREKSETLKTTPEQVVKDIRREIRDMKILAADWPSKTACSKKA